MVNVGIVLLLAAGVAFVIVKKIKAWKKGQCCGCDGCSAECKSHKK